MRRRRPRCRRGDRRTRPRAPSAASTCSCTTPASARAAASSTRGAGADRARGPGELPRLGLDDARVPAGPRRWLARRQRRLGRGHGRGRARTRRRSTHSSRSRARSRAELGGRGISVHTINPGFVETPGFPQRGRLPRAVLPFVPQPNVVARRILRAVDHDQREVFVPRWYRVPAWAQALAPGLIASARARTSRRRPRSRIRRKVQGSLPLGARAAGEIEVRLEVALLANDVLAYKHQAVRHRRAHAGRRRRARVLSTRRAPARSCSARAQPADRPGRADRRRAIVPPGRVTRTSSAIISSGRGV